MGRRDEITSWPRSSYDESGIDVNTVPSSTSAERAADEGRQFVDVGRQIAEPRDFEDVEAIVVSVVAVQESQNTEDDILLHPAGTVKFRYVGDQITVLCSGDVDIQVAKALLKEFWQFISAVSRCWTCFINRRSVVNYPCMCFCNCQECAGEMLFCSMCERNIERTIPLIGNYVINV